MACACKVNQEIDKIQKYYSYKGKGGEEKRTRMTVNRKDAAKTILIYLLLLPIVPVMFLFIICFSLFSKSGRINMGNFLGFIHKTRNGRKQQII